MMMWDNPSSVQMINGEGSLRGAVQVFLLIPSVHIPSAPSVYTNDDGEASLRGAVLVFLSKPSVHIPSAPSVYVNDDGEWSHALLASVDPQVHGLVTTLVSREAWNLMTLDKYDIHILHVLKEGDDAFSRIRVALDSLGRQKPTPDSGSTRQHQLTSTSPEL
ncbi:hypothetical protein LguiB_021117 [Lonicera macranthoides]